MEKILVAYDFSNAANNALDYACRLATYFSSKIGIIHVYTIPATVNDGAYIDIDWHEFRKDTEKRMGEVKAELLKNYPSFSDLEIYIENGPVETSINKVATEKSFELIVMGIEKNPGFFKEHILNSNSVIESRNFNLPVLIVPENYKPHKITNIAFACDYDYNFAGSTTLIQLKYFTAAFNADLKIVHILKPDHLLNLEEATNDYYIEDKLQKTEHKTFFVFDKDVDKGISYFIEQHNIDLLIVEPKQYSFITKLFHKSVTKNLAFHIQIPMLTIHGR